jgi:6-phosphogluconolactonase
MVLSRLSQQHRTATELPRALAQDIATRLQAAIQARGQALLVVSGGKSPMALFEALRVLPIAWAQVTITLADERCVPNTHADSNALLVRTHLLQDLAAAAHLVPMVADDLPLTSPAAMAQAASRRLRALGDADVLVLGMGTDGHTASLFPDAPNLPLAMDLMQSPACVGIELNDPPANAPYARITQNLSMLLSARHIVLPISGDDKRAVLARAKVSPSLSLPISKVLHQDRAPVTVWLTDQD